MNVMKVMRNSKVLYLLLWGVIIAFIAWIFSIGGGGIATSKKDGDKDYIVKVENKTFPPRTLNLAMQFQRDQIRKYLGEEYVDQFMKDAPKNIVSGFVDSLILLGLAEEMGLDAKDAEVADTIQKMYKFTEPATQYPAMLQARGVGPEEFEQLIKADISKTKLVSFFAQRYIYSDKEAEDLYRGENSKFKTKVVSIRSGSYGKDVGAISEADVRSVFEREKSGVTLPERRALKYIMVSSPQIRSSIEIPEGELKAYYETHRDRFGDKPFDAVKGQVKNVMLFTDKGYESKIKEAFEKATDEFKATDTEEKINAFAAKYNLKINTTRPMSQGSPEPPFVTDEKVRVAAFKAEKNKWSDVHEMPMASIRFFVQEILEPRPATFDDLKSDIEAEIKQKRMSELAKSAAYRLKAGFKDAASLEDEAKKAGFQVQDSADIKVGDALPVVGKNDDFAKQIYAADVNQLVGPFETKDGFALAVLLAKNPADMNKFRAEKSDFVNKKAKDDAEKYLKEYVSRKRQEFESKDKIDINQDLLKRYDSKKEG